MGVRHLTVVKKDKKNVVAQYGQWDGQPSKTGKFIINFLQNIDIKSFKEQLEKVELLTNENMDEYLLKCYEQIGVYNGRENITYAEEEAFASKFPELWRDIGSEILKIIAFLRFDEKLQLLDNSDFENNIGSCAFIHTLDFDTNIYSISSKGITIFSTSISQPIEEYEFENLCEKNGW